MRFFDNTPVRSYIISTPLTLERIQEVFKAELDQTPVSLSFFCARTQKSYIGYGDSFQYDETNYGPRSGTQTMTAIGTMERLLDETRIHIDYTCNTGSTEFMFPVAYFFSGIIALAGLAVLIGGRDLSGLTILAVAAIPYGITRLILFHYRTLLDGMHGRILRILRKG